MTTADTPAEIEAADNVLLGDGKTPPRPAEAMALYRRALLEGGLALAAQRLAVMTAQGIGTLPNWEEALNWLTHGAMLGDPTLQAQLALLSGAKISTADEARRARFTIDTNALLAPGEAHALSLEPRIGVIEGFVSPAVAAWLIARAERLLERALVYGASGDAEEDASRTAKTACLEFVQRDLVVAVVQERIARLIRLPIPHHEPPNVLSYEPGEQFTAHFDFVDPDLSFGRDEIGNLGQRVATCLTYLSDGYEGGETLFTDLDLRFKGAVGDCLVFFNVTPDQQPDRRTRHAGLPPTSGRKWLLSQWLRDKMQPLM